MQLRWINCVAFQDLYMDLYSHLMNALPMFPVRRKGVLLSLILFELFLAT